MKHLEDLCVAIAELAYTMTRANKEFHDTERQKFHNLFAAELQGQPINFNLSALLNRVIDQDQKPVEEAYDYSINKLRLNSDFLSPKVKEIFIRLMEKMAKTYPPVNIGKITLIDAFKEDIESIKTNPIFWIMDHKY